VKKVCDSCGGSGQLNFFKGVSRFLLSTEECPECSGLGYIFTAAEDDDGEAETYTQRGRPAKKQEQ
jgi:DnaJ-class molecular chaperone